MTILTGLSKEADVATEASYAIAWNIARSKRPYTDDEFLKENILHAASILDLSNKKLQRFISKMTMYVELETSIPILRCHLKRI